MRRPSVRQPLRWLVSSLVPSLFLLLAACATGDYGYPGGSTPGGYPPASSRQSLSGQVQNVDHGNRRFMLAEDGGQRADIAYDDRTRLVYQGQQQAVAGLEPGDRVRVLAMRDGDLWRADDIEVLQDGRGGGYGGGDERRGAVSYVDTRARVIGFTEGGYTGGEQRASYDSRTVVEYRGSRYPPDALERGDLVRMRLVRSGNGWLAEHILVEVSARDR